MPSVFAGGSFDLFNLDIFKNDTREIKSLLHSQVKYANKTNFDKFIATYDKNYTNADGFNLDTYSELVKDIWGTYDKIVYGIKIKSIDVKDDVAEVAVEETSSADIPVSAKMDGILRSESDSVYHLKKEKGIYIIHIYALILIYKIRNSILFLQQSRNLQFLFAD